MRTIKLCKIYIGIHLYQHYINVGHLLRVSIQRNWGLRKYVRVSTSTSREVYHSNPSFWIREHWIRHSPRHKPVQDRIVSCHQISNVVDHNIKSSYPRVANSCRVRSLALTKFFGVMILWITHKQVKNMTYKHLWKGKRKEHQHVPTKKQDPRTARSVV